MSREQLPDTKAVLAQLKSFQRDTVDYVFKRLYTDDAPTDRFLVADEVGLGKTLVARGLIARAVEHLSERVRRIDIVYICSNADIARQNVSRLQLGRGGRFTLATRLTMMPVELRNLRRTRINYVSFTPATSFDHATSLGQAKERVLLSLLLKKAWGIKSRGSRRLLAGNVHPRRFRRLVEEAKENPDFEIDDGLARQFRRALVQHDRAELREGRTTLRQRFRVLARAMGGRLRRWSLEERRERNEIVGVLRGVLAATGVRALQPDLIILDEFQRFKHLLDPTEDAGRLAHELFTYTDRSTRAKVLLLSATPYKMYTLSREAADDDHYKDFLDTVGFLVRDPARRDEFERLLEQFRMALYRLGEGRLDDVATHKRALESALRQVMVRTERLAVSADRDGMLASIPSPPMELRPGDIHAYLAGQRVARELGHPETIEYWKSAPYLLNFMEGYKLKKDFVQRARRSAAGIAKSLSGSLAGLLPLREIKKFGELDAANPRLRWLLRDAVESGGWRLLWLPPSIPFTRPDGPFAAEGVRRLTKKLVFSSWRVAPRAVASLLSYEVERLTMGAWDPTIQNKPADRQKLRGLLRFARSEGRLTGLPLLTLLYPSRVLAELADPMEFAASRPGKERPTVAEGWGWAAQRLAPRLSQIAGAARARGAEDERWYWAAPILLDLQDHEQEVRAWWGQDDLPSTWRGEEPEGEDDSAWQEHVEAVRELLADSKVLGAPPRDLAEVMAKVGFAAPGVAALRALGRADRGTDGQEHALHNAAARVGWAFRALFNQVEAMALVRSLDRREPYWQRVLEYAAAGDLQSVLDEYAHVLRDSQSAASAPRAEGLARLAEEMCAALELRTSLVKPDGIVVRGDQIRLTAQNFRCHYALRYGDEPQQDESRPVRASQVRAAFNSPFRPFVLVSTSVGQEGLDFHPYCHAVVHWNLPANPVDLEQREGRVHRYKGHAVRRNVAARHADVLDRSPHGDLWSKLFTEAEGQRADSENDLVPYWVYQTENGAKIERHVPSMPLSRERSRIDDLLRSLAVYRMVFGQPRQEDLLAFLRAHVPVEQLERRAVELRIDLAPPRRGRSS